MLCLVKLIFALLAPRTFPAFRQIRKSDPVMLGRIIHIPADSTDIFSGFLNGFWLFGRLDLRGSFQKRWLCRLRSIPEFFIGSKLCLTQVQRQPKNGQIICNPDDGDIIRNNIFLLYQIDNGADQDSDHFR